MGETKHIERYFKTDVIASLVEVCYLGGFDYKEIFELASFITGIDINMSNIAKYRNIIMNELNKTYPDLIRHIYLSNDEILDKKMINKYKKYYHNLYGESMLIKSVKKEVNTKEINILQKKYK